MARFRKALAAVAIAAPVVSAAGAGPALAASPPKDAKVPAPTPCCGGNGVFVTWQVQANAQGYLHVKGAALGNSAVVNTYTGSGSCPAHGVTNVQCAEEWSKISTGYAHEFAYANDNTGKCLDDPEDKAGQTPVQYSCGTYPAQRRWQYTTTHSTGGQTYFNVLQDNAGDICLQTAVGNIYSLAIVDILHGDFPGDLSPLQCDWQ